MEKSYEKYLGWRALVVPQNSKKVNYYKVGQFFAITKWDGFFYCKVGQLLLQKGTGITEGDNYYKVGLNRLLINIDFWYFLSDLWSINFVTVNISNESFYIYKTPIEIRLELEQSFKAFFSKK